MHIVHFRELVLRAKGLSGADRSNDFFGERTTLCDVGELPELELGHEEIHETTSDGDAGDDAGDGEGEFPIAHKGDDETGDKGADKGECNGHLFGNTLLNQMGVGLDTGCDFTRTDIIEKGNVLAQNGTEIVFTDTLGGCLCGTNPGDHVGIGGDEHSETLEKKGSEMEMSEK